MKKTSILLSLLSACLGIGIILIIIGALMGGRIGDFSINPIKQKSNVSHSLPDVSLTDTTDIKSLSFDLSASSIKICAGDSFSITGGKLSKNEVSNGTWTVETDHNMAISIFGRRVDFPMPDIFSLGDDDSEITITLPKDATLVNTEIDLSAGDITIEKMNCTEDVNIDLSAGDVTIDSLTASKASFDLSAGDIDVNQYNISDSVYLDCSAGNITLGSKKYASENVCNDLEIDCSMGDIDVFGKLTGETKANASMGDINLNLVGSNMNYKIGNCNTSLGDVNYTTKDFINKSSNVSVSDDNSEYGTIDISCSMGDIDICYLYASAPHAE